MDEQKPQKYSRRWKYVSVTPESVLDVLSLGISPFVVRIAFPPLPKGYRVMDVNYNWSNRCFDVRVEHESFPEVPDGEETPRLEGWSPDRVECRTVALVEGDSDLPVYRESK